MKAWHFVNGTLRDGRPIPADGVKLVHDGPLVMCQSGFHASKRIVDALNYAPGNTVCRVEIGGKIIHDNDKAVAVERTILWRVDATETLRRFARLCALDVVYLWGAPPIVLEYLKTGREDIRAAAWAAARDAARAAAWDTARAAARDAAGDAAWATARAAAWDTARAAARDKQNRRLTSMIARAK